MVCFWFVLSLMLRALLSSLFRSGALVPSGMCIVIILVHPLMKCSTLQVYILLYFVMCSL